MWNWLHPNSENDAPMKNNPSSQLFDLPLERRWKQQLYPAPIVVAIIRRHSDRGPASRYLLIKRNGQPYNGCWALIGGKWEFGEALHEAIIREVKEETDLDASFVAVRGVVSEQIMPQDDDEHGAHFLLFVCELLTGSEKAKEQGEGALDWFTKTEIELLHDEGAIIPSDFAMLDTFAGAHAAVPHFEAEMDAPISGLRDNPLKLLRFEHIDSFTSANET
jgi:8-oxo-dGTP diphosphatase